MERHLVREALAEFADEQYQRAVWLATEGPLVGSAEEAICQLFDDSGLGDALASGSELFSREIDAALGALRLQLRQLNLLRSPDDLLMDPSMTDIRTSAGQILFALMRREAEHSRSADP